MLNHTGSCLLFRVLTSLTALLASSAATLSCAGTTTRVPKSESPPNYLRETRIINISNPSIQALVLSRKWRDLPESSKIGAVYDYVRNEIQFGYNSDDNIPASQVLADGIGQCNTKATLLIALLRATGVKARFHGFYIDKRMQRGAVNGRAFKLAANKIIHSWVEVFHENQWITLEGFILDQQYLDNLRAAFASSKKEFCGYGVATRNFESPAVDWTGSTPTFIQHAAIVKDLGTLNLQTIFTTRMA